MSAKRPLVVILQSYIPAYRAKFFKELISKANDAGIDVVIAAGAPAGELLQRKDSVHLPFVVPIKQQELKVLGRRLTLRTWPRVTAYADLVVLEQARRNIDIYRLLLPRPLRRKAIALWGHGADYAGSAGRQDEFLRKKLTRNSDWFFAYTAEGVRSVCRQGVSVDQATELRNSTDTAELREHLRAVQGPKLASYRRRHSLGPATAAYLGGLDAGKRIDLLIEAGAEVAKHLPDFRLLIAGDGSSKSFVSDAAAIYPWLTYLGPVVGEAKALVLASAVILTVPGSIGLVAVDSLAAGVPIVTTDDNAHGPEFGYLDPGTTAEVTPVSVEAYSGAVISLLKNTKRLSTMRDACITASQSYSIENMAENFLAGITQFLRAGKSFGNE